jgi:hypothetical protein
MVAVCMAIQLRELESAPRRFQYGHGGGIDGELVDAVKGRSEQMSDQCPQHVAMADKSHVLSLVFSVALGQAAARAKLHVEHRLSAWNAACGSAAVERAPVMSLIQFEK